MNEVNQERIVQGGICWIWYFSNTREDAENWYEELTGRKPESYTVCEPSHRSDKPTEHMWGFRIHR